ncbi:MAG: type IV secretory system conjugative DNA transfer family protein [Hespellia sp.]|nr:type IV secretory system conjugative DNA transfer family protein [Hespellia sp.]
MKIEFKSAISHIKDLLCSSSKQDTPYILLFFYGVLFINLLLSLFAFLHALVMLDYTLMPHSFLYRLFALLLPIVLWFVSTVSDFFNYQSVKKITYLSIALNCSLVITGILYQLLSRLFLPPIMEIKTDEIFTPTMVLILGRLFTQLPLLFFFILFTKWTLSPLLNKKSRALITSFKLSHYLDLQKDTSSIRYPLSIAKDLKTGKPIVVSERDRFLHTLVDGTSGTGKTSSTILPAIRDDLNMRCKAEQQQVKLLKQYTAEGAISYQGTSPFLSVCDFMVSDTDSKGYDDSSVSQGHCEDVLEQLRLQYPVCGITVLAPDDSLTDDVCRLCDGRNLLYHRIDATYSSDGLKKTNWIGMNPFYLAKTLSGTSRHQAIVKKAVIFSDVMQAITDLKGKADSYFTGLNRQMIANLAILVMNTVPLLHHRQATPQDLQMLINNFDLLPPYVSKLENLDRDTRQYTFILQYIKDDLLGKGRTKMEDQSRGTRNIINEFLLMPENREVFCSQDSIDFDQILLRGEITVCNYNLASGDTNAVAFGLFFLLSFNNAVLSRPGTENTRTPHFFYIDELPVLIHSSLEKNFSLFRKFKVAMFCAIQTLDQFEKNDITKYLKGVILGSAHIMVFGRSSLSDMEIFSSMAGIHDDVEEQTTTSETALSSDTPALSYSSRETETQKNTVEEIDIRMRDFQEVTFFTAKDGRPLAPIHAKVSFLKPEDWTCSAFSTEIEWFQRYKSSKQHTESAPSPITHKNTPYSRTQLFRSGCNISHTETKDAAILQQEPAVTDPVRKVEPAQDSRKEDSEQVSRLPEGSESIDDLF